MPLEQFNFTNYVNSSLCWFSFFIYFKSTLGIFSYIVETFFGLEPIATLRAAIPAKFQLFVSIHGNGHLL